MTRDEILTAVKEIYVTKTEADVVDTLVEKLRDALPHSRIIDLIFWSANDFTPEQVVEEAIRREAEYGHTVGD